MIKKIKNLINNLRFWKILPRITHLQQQQVIDKQQLINSMQQLNNSMQQLNNSMQQLNNSMKQQGADIQLHIEIATRFNAWRPLNNKSFPIASEIDRVLSFGEQLDQLQSLAPHAYEIWRPLLDFNANYYVGLPVDSCSVKGHSMAPFFRNFLSQYLEGRVLDIGCGPQPIPSYLENYPVDTIYGIDPLSEPKDHPFHFQKGFAEFLPWEDHQFKVVVSATSLDHVLLLDKVFKEICRVLSKDGLFIVWESIIPGSKPYDPYSQEIKKVDDFHLFHFDHDMFFAAIKPYFTVIEEMPMGLIPDAMTNYFIALQPK